MTNEQRAAIRRIRSAFTAADRAQYHVCIETGMAVFADLHRARSLREKAGR